MNAALSWTACSVPIPRAMRPVPNQVQAHRQNLDHAGVALASPFHRIRTADDVLSLPVASSKLAVGGTYGASERTGGLRADRGRGRGRLSHSAAARRYGVSTSGVGHWV